MDKNRRGATILGINTQAASSLTPSPSSSSLSLLPSRHNPYSSSSSSNNTSYSNPNAYANPNFGLNPSPRPRQTPLQRSGGKLISVENILQYASDIPSAQQRGPPDERKKPGHTRTPSGRHPLDPKLSGRLAPSHQEQRYQQKKQHRQQLLQRQQVQLQLQHGYKHLPARTTKVSEKLVLIPDTSEGIEDGDGKGDYAKDNNAEPMRDEEEEWRRGTGRGRRRQMLGDGDEEDSDDGGDENSRDGLGRKSYAERLPKSRRTEKVARVTAYCTAQAYKLRATAQFLKAKHQNRTKLYDDCLYAVYHLPLLKGLGGLRVRSSLSLKVPGGRSMLDEEIEWNEQRAYRDGEDKYSIDDNDSDEGDGDDENYGFRFVEEGDMNGYTKHQHQQPVEQLFTEQPTDIYDRSEIRESNSRPANSVEQYQSENDSYSRHSPDAHSYFPPPSPSSPPQMQPNNTIQLGELFVFSYGVIVFWNFSERQEKDILADLTFSAGHETGFSLVSRPERDDDFETEEFHLEYDLETPRPRIYNDMITLRSGDHMIKLAMSHAIAQSTKLSFFEERMARTMQEAQHVPRRLALTGKLGMKREEVVGILGRLFMSRVDVNLSSNMLDTPNFFWDSEPTLHPLYNAVREYLEIKARIQVLNERCRVFLDLAEILSDAIADKKMTYITWIIIGLIIISIVVTCSEVILRFSYLSASRRGTRSGFLKQQEMINEVPLLALSSIGGGVDNGVHELL